MSKRLIVVLALLLIPAAGCATATVEALRLERASDSSPDVPRESALCMVAMSVDLLTLPAQVAAFPLTLAYLLLLAELDPRPFVGP